MPNLPIWRVTNAWCEIFARIFEDFSVEFNVTPKWLVNPATNRRLKLDYLYPDIGVAIRLEGAQGKGRRGRLSLEEEAQLRARQEARVKVCRRHGIQLVVVESAAGKPKKAFQQVDTALSRAGQGAGGDMLRQIKKARSAASALSFKISTASDLALYADLWADRQYKIAESKPATAETGPIQPVTFAKGMEVEHTAFGSGVVVSTTPSGNDTLITVDFVTAGQKTLAASLVAGKLIPKNRS